MTLAHALCGPKAGNLDHLRLVAAAAVIVSHAWPLALGPGAVEPLAALTGHSLGGWAVALFFYLSGLLIWQSATRRSVAGFVAARARRILPGLVVALVVTVLLAKLSGSTALLPEVGVYLARGLSLMSIEHHLPAAFATNPYPLAVNGPLWSLSHEVTAYGLCLIAVRSGLLRSRVGWAVFLGLSLAFWVAGPVLSPRLATLAPLWLAFALGMATGGLAAWLPLSFGLALGLAVAAPFGWPFATLALGYGALVLALRLAPKLPQWGDFSFGLYIYGWPVAQVLLHVWPGLTPMALAGFGLVATLPLAVLSWVMIEKPWLHRAPRGLWQDTGAKPA